jgi:hypothetical protein
MAPPSTTTSPAAPPVDGRSLGIDNPHPLIASLWNTVQTSCESAFYSEADWKRLRFELWYANQAMHSRRPISGTPGPLFSNRGPTPTHLLMLSEFSTQLTAVGECSDPAGSGHSRATQRQ